MTPTVMINGGGHLTPPTGTTIDQAQPAAATQANISVQPSAATVAATTPAGTSTATQSPVSAPSSQYQNSYVYGQGYDPQLTGASSIYGQVR